MVFIGRELDHAALKAGFQACMAGAPAEAMEAEGAGAN
jgi:hypothetical protein